MNLNDMSADANALADLLRECIVRNYETRQGVHARPGRFYAVMAEYELLSPIATLSHADRLSYEVFSWLNGSAVLNPSAADKSFTEDDGSMEFGYYLRSGGIALWDSLTMTPEAWTDHKASTGCTLAQELDETIDVTFMSTLNQEEQCWFRRLKEVMWRHHLCNAHNRDLHKIMGLDLGYYHEREIYRVPSNFQEI